MNSCARLLIAPGVAGDARGHFAKGSSGNPSSRPRGIRNPRRRVPDLIARPWVLGKVGQVAKACAGALALRIASEILRV
jgi:hypothetical protein